ncbi:MAG: hypothetical protein IKI22_04200 [Neisseriaceae bacterium]|nr:hypothetical protein [Neisseriaceae bacterium]
MTSNRKNRVLQESQKRNVVGWVERPTNFTNILPEKVNTAGKGKYCRKR